MSVSLLAWLKAQNKPDKFYYRSREGNFALATCGHLLKGDLSCGAFFFDERVRRDKNWLPFLGMQGFFPAYGIMRKGRDYHFFGDIPSLDQAELEFHKPSILSRKNEPDFALWKQNLEKISRSYEKVVLSRKVSLDLDSAPCPFAFLSELEALNADCFSFGVFKPQSSFIGSSPELLFRREGSSLQSEALAATRKVSGDQEEDFLLAQDLLGTEKDLREHSIVCEGIAKCFQGYDPSFSFQHQPKVLKRRFWQHLWQSFSCILPPNVSDEELLERLHPSAALGGYPKEVAQQAILDLEPFDRGLFGAPIGYSLANEAEYAVAIRSACLEKQNLTLYSGAGIVPGSDPLLEWEEIETKLRTFYQLIHEQTVEPALG